jgi:hypothetical protein
LGLSFGLDLGRPDRQKCQKKKEHRERTKNCPSFKNRQGYTPLEVMKMSGFIVFKWAAEIKKGSSRLRAGRPASACAGSYSFFGLLYLDGWALFL